MKKDLAIGYDSFADLIGNQCYYVDNVSGRIKVRHFGG